MLVRFAGKLRRMSVVDSTYSDEAWSTAFLATVLAAMRGSSSLAQSCSILGYQADSERLDDMYDGLFSQIVEYRRAAGYRTPGW